MINNKKILFYQWNAFMQEGIENALKILNVNYDNFYYVFKNLEDWDQDDEFIEKMEKKLHQDKYNIIFSINYVPLISDLCMKYNIKYYCWVYDSPIHIQRTETLKNSCNKIYFFDRGRVEEYRKQGVDTVYHLPLAVDPTTFKLGGLTQADKEFFECDISFVGQLYKSSYHTILRFMDEYERGYLEGIISAQQKISGEKLIDELITDELVKKIDDSFNAATQNKSKVTRNQVVFNLAKEITGRERTMALELLSNRYKVNLYSRDVDDRLKNINYKGYIDYYSQMPNVFSISKINLNITLNTIITGIPLRILDILACGGFLITNYQEELLDYFEPGVDLVIYENPKDLVLKVDYYLKNEEERKHIALNGYQKVLELFSFKDRMKVILQDDLENE